MLRLLKEIWPQLVIPLFTIMYINIVARQGNKYLAHRIDQRLKRMTGEIAAKKPFILALITSWATESSFFQSVFASLMATLVLAQTYPGRAAILQILLLLTLAQMHWWLRKHDAEDLTALYFKRFPSWKHSDLCRWIIILINVATIIIVLAARLKP